MKNKILWITLTLFALILSGCGSNDKSGSTTASTANLPSNSALDAFVSVTPGQINMNLKTISSTSSSAYLGFSTIIPFVKKSDKGIDVEHKNFKFSMVGCEVTLAKFIPDSILLDGENGSSKDLVVMGNVKQTCIPSAYKLIGDVTITASGKSKTLANQTLVETSVDANGNPNGSTDPNKPTVDGNYSLYNVASTLTISKAATEYAVRAQLIGKDLKVVPEKTVDILAFDSRFGSFREMSVTTDVSGWANFIYVSPSTLPANGTTMPVTVVFDENGTRQDSKNMTLSFSSSSTAPSNYNFMNATSISVVSASEKKNITVDLVDSSGVGIAGQAVNITNIPNTYGKFTSAIATTDAAGRATFAYEAPTDLTAVNNTSTNANLIYTDSTGTSLVATITISISATTSTLVTYSLINPTTPITITYPDEQKEIAIQLVKKNIPLAGEEVIAKSISSSFGNIQESKVTTGSDGYARFTYQAASTLTDGTQILEIAYIDSTGVEIDNNVTINVSKIDYSSYSLSVLPGDINVTVDSEFKTIQAYLKDDQGRPAADMNVSVQYFDQKYGVMDKYDARTDANGHIEFSYIAPIGVDVLDGNTTSFSVYLQADHTVAATVNIGFSKSVENSPVSEVYVVPSTLTILLGGENRTVRVTAVDAKNFGVSAHFKIENPTKGGTDYGSFGASEFTTDAQGNADINYTAPSDIDGLADRNISIIETNTNIERILTLKFQQPQQTETLYDLNLSVDNFINVDKTGTLGIVIHESGKPNELIPNAQVIEVNATMKFPNMLRFDNDASNVSYSGTATNSYKLWAKHLSGVAVVQISATIDNGTNNVTLTQEFPVVILSGEISSMSIFHNKNTFDENTGLHEDHYTIHAVDRYGNPVSAGTALHPSLINQPTSAVMSGTGEIKTPGKLSDVNFSEVTDGEDRIIILPTPGKLDKFYMGDWSIKSHTDTELTFDETFSGTNTSGLTYVIGNEKRLITKNNIQQVASADISSPTGSYTTDAQGNVQFVVKYDPVLKGEYFYVAANANSNGKRIGTALESIFFYGAYQLRNIITEINIHQGGGGFTSGFYMLDAVGDKFADFNAKIDNFDTSKGSFGIDNKKDIMTYSAPSDISNLIGTTYEFNMTVSEVEGVYQTIKVHFLDDTDYTNYHLLSNESNFTIAQAGESHLLNFYLRDGNDVVSNKIIKMEAFDPKNGDLSTYALYTDSKGIVQFTYTAPADLSSLYGSSMIFRAYLNDNTVIDNNITVNFNAAGSKDYTGYKLTGVPSDFTISRGGETKIFSLYLEDNDTLPVANEDIYLLDFNRSTGSMDSYTATTDVNGFVSFAYTAPASVSALDTTFKAQMKNSNIVNQQMHITYNAAPSVDVNTTDLDLIAVPNVVNVPQTGGSKSLVLYLEDNSTKTPMKDINISIESFDPNLGIMDRYLGATDENGFVTFVYTATDAQASDPDLNITFRVQGGVPARNTIITVKHQASSAVPTDDLNLIAVPDKINVSTIDTSKNIDLYLENNATKTPVVNQPISAVFFNPNLGKLDKYIANTDANGFVTFTYTAPKDQLPTNDINITFKVDGGEPLRSQDVEVSFNPNGHADINTTNYQLIAVPAVVNVPKTGGTKKLSLYLEDNSTHTPIKDMDISAVFFNPNLGKLDKYLATTDANGFVSFEYTATDAQADDPDLNVTFRVNGGSPDRTSIITIKHQEVAPVDTTNYELFAAPDAIAVSTVDTVKTIDVYLENNVSKLPVEGKTIAAEFFNPNMGKLSSYSIVTDANGYASFAYTSPANQLPNSDLNITFRVDGGSPLRTKIVTVKFQEKQPVSTADMNLTAVPANINVANSAASQVFSLFLENNRTNSPISSQSISAVVFDPNLGRLDNYAVDTDTNGFAQFTYTAPDGQLPSNDLIVTFRVDGGEPLRTTDLNVSFSKSSAEVNTTGYALVAVPAEINISTPSVTKTLSLYLNDSTNQKPVSDTNITAKIFNQTLGTLDRYIVSTDANGYAAFNYTAPSSLPEQNLSIIFVVENGTPTLEKNVSINFVSAQPLDTQNLELTSVPHSFNIETVGGTKTFSLFLEDNSTHTPVAGQEISADTFDPNLGRLTNYSVKTDANGFAQFTYKAPSDQSPSTAVSMTFRVAGGLPERLAVVVATFTQSSEETNTTNYRLVAKPTSISVPTAGGSKTFSLFLDDSVANTPVADQEIQAITFNPNLGVLDRYSAKTDANGFVSFTYTATDAQAGDPDMNITFRIANGNPSKLDTNVTIKHEDGPSANVDTSDMNMTAVPISFNITASNETRTFSIFLENNATSKPVAGQTISAKTFDPNLGRLSSYSVATDANGFAQFTYIAPANQLPTNELNITFGVDNGKPVLEQNVTVTFTQASDKVDTTEYNLIAVPDNISVPNTGGTRTFSLFLENNVTHSPVRNRVITANVFDPNLGRLDTYTATTDNSGFATFIYSSTDEQAGLADFNMTFKILNGDPYTLDTQVKVIHAAGSEINTTGMALTAVPSGVNVPKLGGSATFNLFLEKSNTPVANRVIQAVTFNPNLGRLDKYIATTDDSGFVTFTYTATIAQRDDPDMNITFQVMNGNPTLDTNVTIYHQEMPEVNSTNFLLHPVPPTINVFKAGVTHTIDMYLEDTNKSAPVAGQAISAKFFDPNDGSLSAYTATTDGNGFVSFTYKAPSQMPLNYHTLSVEFYVAGGTVYKNTFVDIKFQPEPDVNTTYYEIEAIPSNLAISTPNTSSPIDVYIKDTNRSAPVEGQTVSADFFDPRSGKLDRYSAVTDANGHVAFSYTTPDPIPSSDLNVSFKIEGATIERRADVNVSFAASSSDVNTSGLNMTIVDDDINITEPSTSKEIKVVLDDGTNPEANISIIAHVFNPKAGMLDKYRATTNSLGAVIFTYTSASNFTLGDLNITFAVEGGAPALEANATIHFVKWESVDTSHYVIYTVPNEVNVTKNAKTTLELYVFEDVNYQPMVGIEMDALGFDTKYGTLNAYKAKTDDNGHVAFEHTAPDTLPDSNTSIIFRVKGGTPLKEANISVNFVETDTSTDTSDMNLTIFPKEINTSIEDGVYDINLTVSSIDSGEIMSGVDIVIEFFDPSDGTMDHYTATTNDNGLVAFRYKTPSLLPTDHNLSIRFFVSNGSPVLDTNLSVNFDYKKYEIYAEENVTVTNIAQSQEINVSLVTIDEDNVSHPAEGKVIVAEYLMPIYGKISVYESVVDASGYAVFTYTSPARFSDINETNVTFYFKDDKKVIGHSRLLFKAQAVSAVEHLYVAPNNITITNANEEKTLTIITTNSDNVGVKSTIQIEEPYFDNTEYGSFTPSGQIETDDTGKVVLVYKAPSSISSIAERNITVTEMSKGIKQDLVIKFNKATGPGIEYDMTVTTPASLRVDNKEHITVIIHETGNIGSVIADVDVNEVNLTSRFTNMLTFDGNESKIYANHGTQSVGVDTNKLSGSAIIEIKANVFNGDRNITLTKIVPVVIQAGQVKAMSLVYNKSELDSDTGLYKVHYTIHAVDRYDNPAKEGITLHPSIINGVSHNGIREEPTGEIIENTNPVEFKDTNNTSAYQQVDSDDLLAIVPYADRLEPLYLGNWSIKDTNGSNSRMTLEESYSGVTVDRLAYIIGNPNRYIDGYGIATADIKSRNGGYVTDSSGNVQFTVTFDPVLSAHTVTIAANAYDSNRTGVSSVEALRAPVAYSTSEVLVTNDGNDSNITISLGVEEFRESLVNVKIDPQSIKSTSADCALKENSDFNNFTTNSNGRISVTIKTGLVTTTSGGCTIEWDASPSSIYKEY